MALNGSTKSLKGDSMLVNIYLNLNGNANEAIDFYTKSLGLKKPEILRFSDLPKSDAYTIPEEMLNNVVHCNLEINNTTFVISDNAPAGEYQDGTNVHLILQFEEFDKMKKTYDKLAIYSDVLIPLSWNEHTRGFALFRDQFGVTWQLTIK